MISGSNSVLAGWLDLNTGINDNLTGVIFWGNNGAASGNKGIYYTTTGGNGAASWTRFNVTGNTADSIIYNNTSFNHCYSAIGVGGYDQLFACGQDTVMNQAVVWHLDMSTLNLSILYNGSTGTSLNKMDYSTYADLYYAVGDNGLVVKFEAGIPGVMVPTVLSNDFTSISFLNNSFVIGSDGARITGTSIALFNCIVDPEPNMNYKDVNKHSSSQSYGIGNKFDHTIFTTNYVYTDYNYGPINGNCLTKTGFSYMVGTDHGIFLSTGTNQKILEWSPTSLNHWINEIQFDRINPLVFACGKNGIILQSNDLGGPLQPYSILLGSSGVCVDGAIHFTYDVGSSNSCQWFINGVHLQTTCNNNAIVWDSIGQFDLEVIAYNSPYSDTVRKAITVVEIPEIDKPYNISDSILCQQGILDVTVLSTQSNIKYELKKRGTTGSFGISSPATGGTLIFTSQIIDESGYYYLRSVSPISSCFSDFTDSIFIEVEKTTADFISTFINVEVGETAQFFEFTKDAQNFSWNFSPIADILTSSAADPINTYNTMGSNPVELICWSDNGCYDTIVKNGPVIFRPSSPPDSCWRNHNLAPDSPWTGFYYEDISQLTKAKNGYFTCGYYNNTTLASQQGDSAMLSGTGGYMSKHSFDGTIKWTVRTKKSGFVANGNTEIIQSVVEDNTGNIYICGVTQGGYDYFYDNKGDSIEIDPQYFIIKLDSVGGIIWNLTSTQFSPFNLFVDNDNNLISSAKLYAYNGTPVEIKKNGIVNDVIVSQVTDRNFAMVKFTPDGDVLWDIPFDISGANGESITKMKVDSNNNIYITGEFETFIKVYDIGSTSYNELVGWPGNFGAKTYLAKFDSQGNFIWAMRSATFGPFSATVVPSDMVVDEFGNIFLAGRNGCQDSTYTHTFFNTDGTSTSVSGGSFFYTRIDSTGSCKWIQTSKFSKFDGGANIYLENNEVSVSGRLIDPDTTNFSLTSKDGLDINFDIAQADYFVAVYDKDGNLKKVMINGDNPNSVVNAQGSTIRTIFSGMFKNDDGSYTLARNVRLLLGSYDEFGSIIDSTNGTDGYVLHFIDGCSNITYSNILEEDTTVIYTNILVVYPNPSAGNFTVDLGSPHTDIRYYIYDISGKLIQSRNVADDQFIYLDLNQASGMYILQIESAETNANLKMQVSKD